MRKSARQQPPRMVERILRGRKAWTRATLRESDYRIEIPPRCQDEIARFVDWLRVNPLQTELLSSQDYRMPAANALMRRVRRTLDHGVGFVVLDRLPVRRFSKAELTAVYWMLSSMIARPVAQAFVGTMLYDVIDTGKKKGPKVRADLTSAELDFHTDYGYNLPPTYFGLQVLRTARKGGRSGVVSLYAAHNAMCRRFPDLLPRLYRPFYLNRYREHGPDEPVASRHPVFAYDGRTLRGRFNLRNITAGYDLMGETLDAEGADAIAAFSEVLEDPALHVDFDLAPGQAEYLLNYQCAHRRTAYQDHSAMDRRRHLVRIFLRDEGARSYNG